MEGSARAFGGGSTIKWNGKTYELPPLTVRDWATIQNEVINRKREAKVAAVAALYGKIPESKWNELYEKASREAERLAAVPDTEVAAWIDTPDGLCFTLWMSLNHKYPGAFVLEDMMEIIVGQLDEKQLQDLIDRRDQANGLDVAGN